MTTSDSEDPLLTAVLVRVAQAHSVDVAALPPLHHVIEPDVLNALFTPRLNGEERSGAITVTFEYAGCRIQIRSPETIVGDCLNATTPPIGHGS